LHLRHPEAKASAGIVTGVPLVAGVSPSGLRLDMPEKTSLRHAGLRACDPFLGLAAIGMLVFAERRHATPGPCTSIPSRSAGVRGRLPVR